MWFYSKVNDGYEPHRIGYLLDAVFRQPDGGKRQFGIGAEFIPYGFGKRRTSKLEPFYLPVPQLMVYRYADGTFGSVASVFLNFVVMPFLEYDFKEHEMRGGAFVKIVFPPPTH